MTAKKKKRSPYDGQVGELEKLRDFTFVAWLAMAEAYDTAQCADFAYLARKIKPLKDALGKLEQLTINLIETERNNE